MGQIQFHSNEARLWEKAETYAMGTDEKEQFNQPDNNSFVDESLNTSINRSGLSRTTIPICDASAQTEDIIQGSN